MIRERIIPKGYFLGDFLKKGVVVEYRVLQGPHN